MKISNADGGGRGRFSGADQGCPEVGTYLERLAYAGSGRPSLQALQALHLAHLRTVPFENLDVHGKVPVVLDVEGLFRKVVGRRRGGFCYELNGLFVWLLEALGFAVERLSARVLDGEGTAGPPFDHLALQVTIGGEHWLADVGFGDGFERPLRLCPGVIQAQSDREYRLRHEGQEWLVEERRSTVGWRGLYWVGEQPRRLEEFTDRCHYHQTAQSSPFTRGRLCTRATPRGRLTLSGRRLIEADRGERRERELGSEDEVRQALREHFAIVL
jgi:N-hydroxyarylamine O-acetyltransferase